MQAAFFSLDQDGGRTPAGLLCQVQEFHEVWDRVLAIVDATEVAVEVAIVFDTKAVGIGEMLVDVFLGEVAEVVGLE